MLLAPRCLRAVLPLLLACLIASTAFAQELRQWSDASGKFKIKAKFKGETDGVVTLEKEDGEELEIELISLSDVPRRTLNGQVTNAVIVAGIARALAKLGVWP